MDYVALNTLIKTHPGYATATDAELAVWCNAKVISRDRETVPASAIFAAILSNRAEWTPLSESDKQLVRDILYVHAAEGVPTKSGAPARTVLTAVLGASTKAVIAAQIVELVSRAVAVGLLGEVSGGDVQYARTL